MVHYDLSYSKILIASMHYQDLEFYTEVSMHAYQNILYMTSYVSSKSKDLSSMVRVTGALLRPVVVTDENGQTYFHLRRNLVSSQLPSRIYK